MEPPIFVDLDRVNSRDDTPLCEPDPSTFCFTGEGGIETGYTDYPAPVEK